MALHKKFPKDKFAILDPKIRWFPADEALREHGYEKLLPPFVPEIRKRVKVWRENNYDGASSTSKALLNWWFKQEHLCYSANGNSFLFQYYFAQREAVETIIWLYDVQGVKNKYDLLPFDSLGRVSPNMFDEDWLRLVIKMATGSGKTKVMSLLLVWSYFHKLYESDSELSRNFLLITPNIIVLERIKTDFEGLKIFYHDPVLPENGFEGRNWNDDFQITLHLQDDLTAISSTGNIFLTNIHRVYESDVKEPSFADEDLTEYFLGNKPVTKTNQSMVDLGDIIRDIDEIMVINDEAHHIHDPKMAWFKSIQDINNKMILKGKQICLQIDCTATPKHNNGGIFVQTVSDYPLVEAIHQGIVKTPVLPDQASRAKLQERQSAIFTEKYEDYINLGIAEWKKTYKELEPTGKKSILFIMTDDTKNCDEVQEYLEKNYVDLNGKVLTIHTNKSGDISEKVTGKAKEELERLRRQANEIDGWESPYKVIVSVLMLKEGWDVKNVTTIVGLRAYSAKSNILPEQTLGRGLRRMFFGYEDVEEYVSVIGTPAFMDFVESIKAEGVDLEKRKMDVLSDPVTPTVIEVDHENTRKDINKLDIELPILTPRIQREYKNLSDLVVSNFENEKLNIKNFSEQEQREIVFKHVVEDKVHHTTTLDSNIEPNYQSVVGFFAQSIMRELRLFGCYDVLFGKVKEFIKIHLFKNEVDLNDKNILRNLSEIVVTRTIIESFKKSINDLTVKDVGDAEIKNYIKVSSSRPFVVNNRAYLIPKKSVFNKIVGDSQFELEFADFLERLSDNEIISFAKNYYEVHFKIDYKNADGTIAHYYPDFFVKTTENAVYIIETKGREDLDDPLKIARLAQWCNDANNRQKKIEYKMLYVKQEDWEKYNPKSWDDVVSISELLKKDIQDKRIGILYGPRDFWLDKTMPIKSKVEHEKEKEYNIVRVFYGTNRKQKNSKNKKISYGFKRGIMNYGYCDVSIPLDHRLGMLETPSLMKLQFIKDPNKYIVLLQVNILDNNEFFQNLNINLHNSKKREAFVFIHGYNVNFKDAARTTAQMKYDLRFDGPAIFFSWPSLGKYSGYLVDQNNIRWSVPFIQEFLEDIVNKTQAQIVHVIAHSMGNLGLAEALAEIAEKQSVHSPKIKEIILTAPDIDKAIFVSNIFPKLANIKSRITLYASSKDKALQVAKKFHGYVRLGDIKNYPIIIDGLDSIDATQVDTSLMGHSYYAENKSVLSDIFYLINNSMDISKRFGLEPITSNEGVYWKFKI